MSDKSDPYSRFDKEQLMLRDELAMDRTALANERTLLAYIRTALALLLAGVTFIYFSKAVWFSIVGIVCLIVGLAGLAFGVQRYWRMRKALILLRRRRDYAASTDKAKDAEQAQQSSRGA